MNPYTQEVLTMIAKVRTRLRNWLLAAFVHTNSLPATVRRLALVLSLRLAPMFGGATTSNAQLGKVTVSYWNAAPSPDAWTAIPNIRTVNGMSITKNEEDSTDMDSSAAEFIPGLAVGDMLEFTAIANSTTVPLFEGWVNASPVANIDLRFAFPAPASLTRYLSVAPLHVGNPTLTRGGIWECTFRGRISGGISSTPSH
jgi:hypothetical protein